MKVLVCTAMMEIGGSQTNAIELAVGVRDLGHDVTVWGPPGELVEVARAAGLDVVQAARERHWPSAANIARLNQLVVDRGIDLVHAYEWGPAVDLAFGPHRRYGIPMLITVLSMSVPDFLPAHVPLVVGTAALARQESARGRSVSLMEPPVDTSRNAPGGGDAPRARFGLGADDLVVSVVGRLVDDLGKLPGVLDAIGVVDELARRRPVRLLVVGDGPGLPLVRRRAQEVNGHHGRDVVQATGALLDPRDAYAAADVVLGMGSSALKGMAFAKPLVVQGEAGFWRLLDEESLPAFLTSGWHGVGGAGPADLLAALTPLLDDPARRRELGDLGRATVVRRCSLTQASAALARLYEAVASSPPSARARLLGLAGAAGRLGRFKFALARQRWSGGPGARVATLPAGGGA